MLKNMLSVRNLKLWSQSLRLVFVLILLLSATGVAFAENDSAPNAVVSDIIVVPRNYNFTWGSSGQNIDANNDVYCSSNPDFWQVLYWRTSDTNSSAGVNDWNPTVTVAGDYDIYVYIPDYTHAASITTQAKYYFNGGLLATLDQNQNKCQWVYLGRRWFDAGNGHTISMPAQTSDNPYRLIAGDGLRLVYVEPYYSISGRVVDSGNNSIPGVTISLNTGATTSTDGNGNYSFSGLAAGSYSITPSRAGDSFTPSTTNVNLSSNITGVNFTVTTRYYISGRLTDTSGSAIPNVTLTCYGLSTQMTTTSDSSGRYTFANLVAGIYQIKPDRNVYPFSPQVRGWMFVPPNQINQDFVTTPVYGNIGGKVTVEGTSTPIANARVNIAGKVAQTDASGDYTISNVLPGNHVAYVSAAGYKDHQSSVVVIPNSSIKKDVVLTKVLINGYRLPFPAGTTYSLNRTNHGNSGYAQDWSLKRGDQVVASRAGIVLYQPVENFDTYACDSSYGSKGNYIVIKHDDGMLTWYVHLAKNGAFVNKNDVVKAGQVIGVTGLTGFMCGTPPDHLHFAFTDMSKKRFIPVLLDVLTNGGIPQVGKSYTSGNYLLTGDETNAGILSTPDVTAPIGSLRLRLTGTSNYAVELTAFDYESDVIQVRLATNESGLASAAWQTLTDTVSWSNPIVVGQFKDASGNLSPIYTDVIEQIAYESIQTAFSVSSQICSGADFEIQNLSYPLCEQCGWSWDMGEGTTAQGIEPSWPVYVDEFVYLTPGNYTITLTAKNADSINTTSQEVQVVPSPSLGFSITRLDRTVWVNALEENASSWQWDFGDGGTVSGRTASHTYATVEDLNQAVVKLVVTGANGCSSTSYQQPPVPFHVYLPALAK